jgi:DNA repair protein RadC
MEEKLLKDLLCDKIDNNVSQKTKKKSSKKIQLLIPMPRMKMIKDKTLRVQLDKPVMTHPEKVLLILRAIYSDLTDGQEYAYLITLDIKGKFINAWSIGQGGDDHVIISPKQVFRRVLADDNAAAFIICHNHPSGNPQPSDDDYFMLQDLKRCATSLDTPLRDFIIIADGCEKYYSHRNENYEL